eukprot:CAMPEP_0175413852 /NCGR_PEP_ID=MMETSP0095-20121207/43366_1 /TAXON_ID=311494 /ORGANISM="Alexandrium monilatum, Strain CCMP3105" /LENGTH=44 /DNA_ID= /DNA_START= /DNA_END= /DNA_ORIENTATION=
MSPRCWRIFAKCQKEPSSITSINFVATAFRKCPDGSSALQRLPE